MNFDFIIEAFPDLKTKISEDGDTITIFNPRSNDNIIVDYEFYMSTDKTDSFERYTTQFSYQHRHFSNEADVLEWIKSITDNSLLAIEFFEGTESRFGGEILFSSISQLTYDVFVKKYSYYNEFSQCDNFKIRGWNCENDYDGYIVKRNPKSIYLIINKI